MTGGARGIGRATVERLLGRGDRVAVLDLSTETEDGYLDDWLARGAEVSIQTTGARRYITPRDSSTGRRSADARTTTRSALRTPRPHACFNS